MTASDSFIGRTVANKYLIRERLGAGGMGAVYRAQHTETGGDVAVKVLHGTAAFDEKMIKRFRLEAQNAAALRHTNTIRVNDFGVDDGLFYLVMEYLDGRPLSAVIRDEGPLPWRRAVHIARQVLMSLWEAHEHAKQIVHRDIKPANIVLIDLPGSADHVKVLDFGIARSLAGTGAGTQGFIGTPFYMAPELWRGEVVDATTDLYALGCVVFQMLAGAPPFTPPPSATDILLPLLGMHCHDDPPPTLDAAPGTPPGVAAWVDRLLKKDRAERPPSAREALAELDAASAEAERAQPPLNTPPAPPAPGRPLPASMASAMAEPGADALGDTALATVTRTSTGGAAPPTPGGAPKRQISGLLIAVGVLLGMAALAVALYLGAMAGDEPSGAVAEPTPPPAPHRYIATFDESQPLGARTDAYRARLGPQDHLHLNGARHTTAGQVLVQDRMNYDLRGIRDPDDAPASPVTDVNTLDAAVALLDRVLDPALAQKIVSGTPLVDVEIFENGIAIELLDE